MIIDDRPIVWTMDGGSPAERLEPVTVAMARQSLRFGPTSEDALIAAYIQAARAYFEEQTGRAIIHTTWERAAPSAPCTSVVELPRPPLVGDVAIEYDTANGETVTMDPETYTVWPSGFLDGSDIVLDPYCACGRIELAAGASWPTTSGQARSFRIRRLCGYSATVAGVPGVIQSALYMLIGHFHRNREAVTAAQHFELPMGAQILIDQFKYRALPSV